MSLFFLHLKTSNITFKDIHVCYNTYIHILYILTEHVFAFTCVARFFPSDNECVKRNVLVCMNRKVDLVTIVFWWNIISRLLSLFHSLPFSISSLFLLSHSVCTINRIWIDMKYCFHLNDRKKSIRLFIDNQINTVIILNE